MVLGGPTGRFYSTAASAQRVVSQWSLGLGQSVAAGAEAIHLPSIH